jgi:hypothetical protein
MGFTCTTFADEGERVTSDDARVSSVNRSISFTPHLLAGTPNLVAQGLGSSDGSARMIGQLASAGDGFIQSGFLRWGQHGGVS